MKLVIFDFDKTLVHLHVDWAQVKRDVLSLADSRGIAVRGSQRLVPLGNMLSRDPALKGEIDLIYLRHELACVDGGKYEAYPDMLALMRELKGKGLRIAIVSGNHSQTIERILSALGLLGYIDLVCGRDKVKDGKPSAEPALMVMEALGAQRGETLFVGDSVYDSMSAEAAGVRFFQVEPGSVGDAAKIKALC